MTYPEIVHAQLQKIINLWLEYEQHYSKEKRLERMRMITLADVINALIYFEGGSLDKELKRAGFDITSSAFIQRRHQIVSAVLQDILADFSEQNDEYETFQGYRVCAIDGSSINIPRDPLARTFIQHPGAPNGYNQLKVHTIYDVLSRTYLSAEIHPQPEQDEIGALEFLLTWYDIKGKLLLVGDRGYSSYALFATLLERRNTDFLIRVKQGRGAMKCIAGLPMEEFDRKISFTITTTQTNEDKKNGFVFIQTQKNSNRTYSPKTRAGRWSFPSPYPVTLRIVRMRLSTGEYETLATSLPSSITASQIKELYHARWGIETAFRELKYNYGLTNIHGRSEEFARQEIYAAMIFSNFCSRIINKVVIQHWKNGKMFEVNRKMAAFLCKEYLRTPNADGDQLMQNMSFQSNRDSRIREISERSHGAVLVIACPHKLLKIILIPRNENY